MNGSEKSDLDYAIRGISEDTPKDLDISLEKELRLYIQFKNNSLAYKNKLLNPDISKDEFVNNHGEHLYHASRAIEIANNIKKESNEPELNKLLGNCIDELTEEMIDFEKIKERF